MITIRNQVPFEVFGPEGKREDMGAFDLEDFNISYMISDSINIPEGGYIRLQVDEHFWIVVKGSKVEVAQG